MVQAFDEMNTKVSESQNASTRKCRKGGGGAGATREASEGLSVPSAQFGDILSMSWFKRGAHGPIRAALLCKLWLMVQTFGKGNGGPNAQVARVWCTDVGLVGGGVHVYGS